MPEPQARAGHSVALLDQLADAGYHFHARVFRDAKSILYNAASVSGDPAEDSRTVRVEWRHLCICPRVRAFVAPASV